MLLEELLGEALRVVDKMERGEVQRMGRVFLAFLSVQLLAATGICEKCRTYLLTLSWALSSALSLFLDFLLIPD